MAVLVGGQRGVRGFGLPAQGAAHPAQRLVGGHGQRGALPVDHELLEREFKKGQCSRLPGHIREQITDQVGLEAQAHVGQGGGQLDSLAQLGHAHRQHRLAPYLRGVLSGGMR